MLKREPVRMLYNAARHTENETWQHKAAEAYKHLSTSDFEQKDVDIQYLDELKWSAALQAAASKHHSNIFYSVETATIIAIPLPARGHKGLTLATFMMILHYFHEIRAHSTYSKFHQLSSNYVHKIEDISRHHHANHATIAGQTIHWRIIHRYYGTSRRLLHPEVFEPHVQPEDLSYRKAEHLLYRLEPALYFWRDLDYVGLSHGDGPISFNLMDVVLNLLNDIPYESRLNYHLRDSIWNELLIRYIGQRPLERQLLQHLEENTLDSVVIDSGMEFAL